VHRDKIRSLRDELEDGVRLEAEAKAEAAAMQRMMQVPQKSPTESKISLRKAKEPYGQQKSIVRELF
jgi:hypothetical protein